MMIKYVACKSGWNMFPDDGGSFRWDDEYKWTVRKAKFEKETPKCVYWKGDRYNKSVIDYHIFDTETEASEHLIEMLKERKESLIKTIKNRQKELEEIETAEGKLIHLKGI